MFFEILLLTGLVVTCDLVSNDAKKVWLTSSLLKPIWGSNFRDKHNFQIFNKQILKKCQNFNIKP